MRKVVVASAFAFGIAACSDVPTSVAPSESLAPSAASFARGGGGVPIPGRYIVQFRSDVNDVDGEASKLSIRHAGKLRHLYRSALKGMVIELPAAAAAALRADPNVVLVEQDQTMTISTTQTSATWGIDRVDQLTLPLGTTYVYNADGTGVTVYIIDTGMNLGHTEFTGRASTGYDAVTAGGTAADCNGHGTHVAGTVGGTTYGVAKKVSLVAVRVLDCAGSGTTSGVIAGIDWVTANRKLPAAANMSLGGGVSAALNTAVKNSVAAGVVYAVAAGNDGADACQHSPAAEPTAITVGATDSEDVFATFSNRGSCVDINAPGVSITSAWYNTTTATNTISGTSMATPHVAGAAALYLQANPAANPAAVDAALKANASTTVVPAGTTNKFLYTGFISAAPYVGAPVSSFTASCSGMTCSFNGSGSKAEGSITYAWDFGDGATAGSVATTSRTYLAENATGYTVTLTVTDASGRTNASSQVVSPKPIPSPVASFTKSCSSRTCTFNASATTNATSYSWNFGDGTTGTGISVSHQFARNKSYTVTLTATGAGGSSTATTPVTCTRSCS